MPRYQEQLASWGELRWRIESIQLPAERKHHDALLLQPNLIGIADGATPLNNDHSIDPGEFARAALRELSAHSHLATSRMFEQAIRSVRSERASQEQNASCTVAIATARGRSADLAVLGDCLIVAQLRGGDHVVLKDERLESRDLKASLLIARSISEGLSLEEALTRAMPLLRRHRSQMNRPGSYWTFADDDRASGELVQRRVPQDAIEAMLLCTDGFSRVIDPFSLVDNEPGLLRAALKRGLERLASELREAELADNSVQSFPRLSVTDDATAILVVPEGR
jgi:serine/threonine protein phosphatase PrpC